MYYTCQEVADMFRVSIQTVWKWTRQGKLGKTELGYNQYRISDEDIARFTNERKAK